jgi:hypothetical protein
VLLELREVLVDRADRGRPLADRSGDALHRPDPDVARREQPVQGGLKGQPGPVRGLAARHGHVGQHESVLVPGDLGRQPAAGRLRADEAEQPPAAEPPDRARSGVAQLDRLEVIAAVDRADDRRGGHVDLVVRLDTVD